MIDSNVRAINNVINSPSAIKNGAVYAWNRGGQIGRAGVNDPANSGIGVLKSGLNFGPESFNLLANGAKGILNLESYGLDLAGSDFGKSFRETDAYNLPTFNYNGDAQKLGGGVGVALQLATPAAVSKIGAIRLNAKLAVAAEQMSAYEASLVAEGANNVASIDGLNLNVRPNGTSFDGIITRLENPARVDTTFDVHAGNIAADHRYSGPGNGAVYGATSPETAFAEVDHYGLTKGRVYVSQDVKFSNVLDLTSPTVQKQLNFSLDQITGNSYLVTHQLGDFARASGYDALLAPSARNLGGTNLVIFPKVN